MKVIVLIPAAGMGRRMGGGINKQYLKLAGQPILAHTLALFDSHPLVDHIYVIAPQEDIDFCLREVVEPCRLTKVRRIVPGGAERQDSVRNGLGACEAEAEDIVLIHDGVRPFFPADLLQEVIDKATQVGASVVGVPVKDTIKEVSDGLIQGTPERRRLWKAQTPQAFRYALISEAHRRAQVEGYLGTDDASLVERLGRKVAMVEGDYRNIKITTPDDLVLAGAFLKTRGGIDR